MRIHPHALLPVLVAGAAAIAGSGAAAGQASVSSAGSASFSDAGATPAAKQATVDALTRHLQALAKRYLPAEQTLKVEMLDIDLAGVLRPSARAGTELRIMKGGADWPRIKLRYALEANGQPLLSGEESVADMDYANGFGVGRGADPLHSEKKMLDAWFKARLVERKPSAG
jgi:Protein of unknown function (DUF3016)